MLKKVSENDKGSMEEKVSLFFGTNRYTSSNITLKNKLFWAWNGELTHDEVRRQISDFAQKGFGGFFIHARGGLTVPYMGEEWMQAVDVAVSAAEKHGLEAWLYDEYGWPSGFGGGEVNGKGEKYRQKSLVANPRGNNVLARFKKCARVTPPQSGKRYECFADSGYAVCGKDEAADIEYGYEVNPFYADILDGDAVDAFIACTHERYKERFGAKFGGAIKGIFTDEPQYSRPYGESLFEYFTERNGYEPAPWLFLLDADCEAGRVFRADYYGAVCELFEKNYVRKISAWCKINGLLFTGHFPEEDGISTQFLKGGDTMLNYVDMEYPGIDFLGRRLTSPVLIKQISSVKNQLGKEHVLSETFGCCGWNTALWQYRRIWGYQSALGIDSACIHLAAYSMRGVRKRDYPAFFSYQSSWWEQAGALNEYMRALNEFSDLGKPVNDVLLISPVSDAYAEKEHSSEAGFVSTQFRLTVEAFLDLQMQFDVADENYLAAVLPTVSGKKVHVGNMSYSVLVVPYMRSICKHTLKLVSDAVKCGVKVVFATAKPQYFDNVLPVNQADFNGCAVVQNRAALWGKYFTSVAYENKVIATAKSDGYCLEGLIVRVREDEGHYYIAVYNKSVENASGGLLRIADTGTLYKLNIQDGKEENTTLRSDGRYTTGTFSIPRGETALFVFRKGEIRYAPVWVEDRTERLLPLLAELSHENTFTVDKAAMSVDGGEYGEEKYILRIQEDMFRLASESDAVRKVSVKYRFNVRDLPRKIAICCENATADCVALNGATVETNSDFYIDRHIKRADVTALVKKGENEIVMTYTVQPQKQDFDVDEVFESEKNRFAYTAEAESVFLTGLFDVEAVGGERRSPRCYWVDDGKFELVAQRAKDFSSDLTPQGLWFYRGNVKREFAYEYADGRIFLSLDGAEGVLTKVSVNAKYVGCISGGESLEITEALRKGKNKIETELVSGNRNALGPHHHYMGEQRFVGVNTFRGTRGYEDNVVASAAPENTFVSAYAFVPLAVGELYATQKRQIRKQEDN